jgi:hypothetical protein
LTLECAQTGLRARLVGYWCSRHTLATPWGEHNGVEEINTPQFLLCPLNIFFTLL